MNIHHMTFGLRPAGLSPSLRSSVIAWWKFDGNSNDASGNGHNGTDTDVTYVAGLINQAASFNGTTSVVTVPDSDAFSFGGGSPDLPFSVSCWIGGGDYPSAHGIIGKGNNDLDTTNEWNWFIFSNTMYLVLRDKTTNNVYLGGFYFIDFSASRRHLVATYNGNGTLAGIKLYVNGVSKTVSSFSNGTYTGMHNTTRSLYLGRLGNAFSFGNTIDELSLFDKEISAAEVSELYNSGAGITI